MREPMTVEVVCGACEGTGLTSGYPGYAPQGGSDGVQYTCWACYGEKVLLCTLASGSRSELVQRLGGLALRRGIFVKPPEWDFAPEQQEWNSLIAAIRQHDAEHGRPDV